MRLKLDFSNDFTDFLTNNLSCGLVKVVTQTETFECSGVLLAQHSSVLREYLKEDKELFLTDNKHVRECLTILYGGSVELTEENFQDILKFMVSYNITSVRDQVLDWMSRNNWNLDNAVFLVNGSITVAKALGVKTTESLDLREKILKACRLFFSKQLVTQINPSNSDLRYISLQSAMESVVPEIEDKSHLLNVLLHEDFIPEYIPWIIELIDQSSYSMFLSRLQTIEITNKMALLTRLQFEELFDKIEDFEIMTLKEYKHLNKYKMNINEKMAIILSLRFMKGSGSLYSCWKILDENGILLLPKAFTDKSDQFCIIECLLSWLAANPQSISTATVRESLSDVTLRLIQLPRNIVTETCWNFSYHYANLKKPANLPNIGLNIKITGYDYSIEGEEIVIEFKYMRHHEHEQSIELCPQCGQSRYHQPRHPSSPNEVFEVTARLFKDRIPCVTATDQTKLAEKYAQPKAATDPRYNYRYNEVNKKIYRSISSYGNYSMHVFAQKINNGERIPLYCDPGEAYKIVWGAIQRNKDKICIPSVNFSVLFVGL